MPHLVSEAIEVFETLGMSWKSEADLDSVNDVTVKRNYRKLALKLHPDKNKHDPNAEAKFNKLKNAHDKLLSLSTRSELIHLLRGKLLYLREMDKRHAMTQEFSRILEEREKAARGSGSIPFQNGKSFQAMRMHHRDLIDELQSRRDDLARSRHFSNNNSASSPNSAQETYPVPDDSVRDLNYWFDYSLNEPLSVRAERQKKFSEFIGRLVHS